MNTKKSILIAILMAAAVWSPGQTNQPYAVKGKIDIDFKSRVGTPKKGVTQDTYTIDVSVAGTSRFVGTVVALPQLRDSGTFGYGAKIIQNRRLTYDVACEVTSQKSGRSMNVGSISGSVLINPDGLYQYDTGNLALDITKGGLSYTSKFTGSANGKPLGRPDGWLENLQRQTVNITRSVGGGKQATVQLTKYDYLDFHNCVLCAGPAEAYSSVTLNGRMLYDYKNGKECWYFDNNFAMSYSGHHDAVTGTIRWMKDPKYTENGKSRYEFDVRVNEPPPSENMGSTPTDEESFFNDDPTVPSLKGVMTYDDAQPVNNTPRSIVGIDLKSSNLTKQQVMALTKLFILAAVEPMNSD